MRTKLLSALLLASTAIAGVASADPIVRDHRNDRNDRSQRIERHSDRDYRNGYRSEYRPAPQYSWSGGVQVTTRPSWMPQVNYGYQLDADGDEVRPYTYGNDPYVEGIARGEWSTLNPCIDISGHDAHREALGGRPLQSVEFQATRGNAYIYTVGVIFADGSQRSFHIKRALDANHEPNLRVDLGNEGLRGVNAVVLDGVGNVSVRMLGA